MVHNAYEQPKFYFKEQHNLYVGAYFITINRDDSLLPDLYKMIYQDYYLCITTHYCTIFILTNYFG